MKCFYLFIGILLIAQTYSIVTGQQDSPEPRVLSCEGHRQLDQVFYDVHFVNDGRVASNFRIGNKYSKNMEPGEEGTITISYPFPPEQHHHSAEIRLCVGGYLSYEKCVSYVCSYSDGPPPESNENLFSTEKLEETCLPAFVLLGIFLGFFKKL
ncbi:hypothetical protein GF415_03985 [Candidatus Micrarchaeota archaeon]|nr:hypothetical protein [Candidatus Micrarchaeota archaeon]